MKKRKDNLCKEIHSKIRCHFEATKLENSKCTQSTEQKTLRSQQLKVHMQVTLNILEVDVAALQTLVTKVDIQLVQSLEGIKSI